VQYGEDPPRAGWHFHIYPELQPGDGWQPGDVCPEIWEEVVAIPGRTDLNHFMTEIQRIQQWLAMYGSPDDEIWITEMGCLLPGAGEGCPTPSKNGVDTMAEYIGAVTHYLNGDGRWITRYAWYTEKQQSGLWPATWLMEDLTIPIFTEAGEYYAQITPSAYEPKFFYIAFSPIVLSSDVAVQEPSTPELPPAGYPPLQSPYP
jgi:hypothetical protein